MKKKIATRPLSGFDELDAAGIGAGYRAFEEEQPVAEAPKEKSTSLGDYSNAAGSGVLKGIAGTATGIGTFAQAPAANTLSGVLGARALVDHGVTGVRNWINPGSSALDEDVQSNARMASQFAAEERAKNSADGGIAGAAKSVEGFGRASTQALKDFDENYNPELIKQEKNVSDAKGFWGTAKATLSNPLALTGSLAQSAPDMALGVGVGSLAARSRMALGLGAVEKAGAAAAKTVAASGGDLVAQGVAANAARDAAAQALQKSATHVAGSVGVVSESASSAYGGREGTYQQVMGMPEQTLLKTPRYNAILAATGDPAKARMQFANEIADQAPMLTALGTALGSMAITKITGHDLTAELAAGAKKTTAKDIAVNALGHEGPEEVLQGIPEDLVQHGAMVQADQDHELDLGGGIAQNYIAGAVMGAGGTGASYVNDKFGKQAPVDPAAAAAKLLADQQEAASKAAVGAAHAAAATPNSPIARAAAAANPLTPEEAWAKAQELDAQAALDEANGVEQVGPPAEPPAQQDGAMDALVAHQNADPTIQESLQVQPAPAFDAQAAQEQYRADTLAAQKAQDDELNAQAEAALAKMAQRKQQTRPVNEVVSDGGYLYEGTQDGDVLNGLGKPFSIKMGALQEAKRQARDNGGDWTVAPVFDGYVARKKEASNVGVQDGTEPRSAEPDELAGDNANAGMGDRPVDRLPEGDNPLGADADPLGQSGEQAGGVDAAPVAQTLTEAKRIDYGDGYTGIEYSFGSGGTANVMVKPDGSAYLTDIVLGDSESDSRGKGQGTAAYIELGRQLAEQGVKLESTRWSKHKSAIAPSALRIWQKLEAAGLARQTGVEEGKVYDRFSSNEAEVKSIPVYEFIGNQSNNVQNTAPAASQTRTKPLAGQPIDKDWTAFHPESGTLDVPRDDMPQIEAGHRGAMVNFLKARGISSTQEEVPTESLKPTQREYSPEKVEKAKVFKGNNRSILVSSDGHVLDGHHQWVAKHESGEPVKVIRLDAPIDALLSAVREFPSAETTVNSTTQEQASEKAAKAEQESAKPEAAAGNSAIHDSGADQPAAEQAGAGKAEVASPDSFVKSPGGSLDFGEITPEMSKAMRRQAGKIRLRQGNAAWGLTHIEQRHGKDFAALGFNSALEFVSKVASGFTKIYQGRGAAIDVVIDDESRGMLIVQLEPSSDGDFYDIKTATPTRRDQFKNEKPLWERDGPIASTADKGGTSYPRGQSGTVSLPEPAESSKRPKNWDKNYGAASKIAEALGVALRGANGKMKKVPELVADIKALDVGGKPSPDGDGQHDELDSEMRAYEERATRIESTLSNGGHVVGDQLRSNNGMGLMKLTPAELTRIPENKVREKPDPEKARVDTVKNQPKIDTSAEPVQKPAESGQVDAPQIEWTRTRNVDRMGIALKAGFKESVAESLSKRSWSSLDVVVQEKLAEAMAEPQEKPSEPPPAPTGEDALYTSTAKLTQPYTLDDFIGNVDAGYRAHFDYAGADGRTLWIERVEGGWVLKSKDDDSTMTITKGGAGAGGRWSKAQALREAENDAKYRYTEWKPVAGVMFQSSGEKAAITAGFKYLTNDHTWVKTVAAGEKRSELFNIREFGPENDRSYRVTKATSFPGTGATGSPSVDMGTFKTLDAAVQATGKASKFQSSSPAVQDFIDGKRDDAPTIEEVKAEKPATVTLPATVSGAIEDQLRKQKRRLMRLKTEASKDGMTLAEKVSAQTKHSEAESELRKMRTTLFDAEDAAVKALASGNPEDFAAHKELFPDAFAEISKLTAKPELSPLIKAMNFLMELQAKQDANGMIGDDRLETKIRQQKAVVKELQDAANKPVDTPSQEPSNTVKSTPNEDAPISAEDRAVLDAAKAKIEELDAKIERHEALLDCLK